VLTPGVQALSQGDLDKGRGHRHPRSLTETTVNRSSCARVVRRARTPVAPKGQVTWVGIAAFRLAAISWVAPS
jgi:hypothetical protein